MKTSSLSVVALAALVLLAAQYTSLADSSSPRVIIVGAGMSGISAGKQLWESGVQDLLILEATERVGGRMHKHNFGGLNVEIGANWVEGLGGDNLNPIWPIVNSTLKLRTFYSDFDSVVGCVYKENGGGLYDEEYVQKRMDRAYEVLDLGANLTKKMRPSGQDDISLLAMQRLFNQYPAERAGDAGGHGAGLLHIRLRVRGAAAGDEHAEHAADAHQRRLRRGQLLRRGPERLRVHHTLHRQLLPQHRRQRQALRPQDPAQQGGAADRVQPTRCGRKDGGRLVLQRGLRHRLHQPGRPADRPHQVHAPAAFLEDRCDLPFRHGRVHQDLPQVSHQVLARGRGEAVLRVREQPARVLRDVAVVRAGVPGRQRAHGHRHRRRVAADRAAERQPDQGGGGGGAARHVPRRRRAGPRRDRRLRAALVVQPLLQGRLLQLAHRRQPLRVPPAQGSGWEGVLHW